MDAAGWRMAALDCRRERRKGQPGIDPPAERVAHDAARPRVHDRREVDEAAEDGDVGQIGNPELVRAIDLALPGAIGEDRFVMIAVGGGDEAAPARQVAGRAHASGA